jgi:hypothetical protein
MKKLLIIHIFLSSFVGLPYGWSQQEELLEVSGTPPRTEVESKFAAVIPEGFDDNDFTMTLHKILDAYSGKLSFGDKAGCNLTLDGSPKSFAFLDEYYDTDDRKILKSNSAYRLRFRWNRFLSYVRSKLYPFSSQFNPTRTEIQAKVGYERLSENKMTTTETRFEFRKESEPFVDGVELPPVSWEVENYRNIAISGQYKNYKIYPYDALEEIISPKDNLTPKLGLLTKRNRMHFNCKSPFGSGPNPEQLFIITLDRVFCEHGCIDRKNLLEIEIERERNTSTTLDQVAGYENTSFFSNPKVADLAVIFAKKVKQAFDDDHTKISDVVKSYLIENGLSPLPANYKYARFSGKASSKAIEIEQL